MSRLIVKNLPNKVTPEYLKDIFGEKGEVTDVQLKHTKDGRFRNFGFIGYRNEEQANSAREYFDGTCIKSMKIQVEICANLGDEKKPRAWSKYATDSTAYKNLHKDDSAKPSKKAVKIEKNKNKIVELLKKHRNDPLFEEFIKAHTNEQTSWIKDAFNKAINSDDDDDSGVDDTETQTESLLTEDNSVNAGDKSSEINNEIKPKPENKETSAKDNISDLEYMKSLMKKVSPKETDKDVKVKENPSDEPKKVRNRPLFYVKINGLPFKCKKKDVKEFFRPLVPFSIRLPLGKGRKLAGFCYVGFRTEQEQKKALNKDKLFIGNHRLHVQKYENQLQKAQEEENENSRRKIQEKEINEETIGESGSIFVRNLPYVVSEEELTKLFEKYGPLAEVNMPIDPVLRQPKGFATVTFVIPEHAVRAFTELDGTAFCGRMMHLLPAKAAKVEDDSGDEGLSFKEKKANKLKQQAKSSHNWNTLFLGADAVADVVASHYNTTKEQLLTENSKNTSAAVRLALGETQLVAQTKAFLESNGVYLDSFNNPSKRRSKTCILVKNLPANTNSEEIKSLFIKYGHIARFLMPEHGITALVDFIEPFEAKKAFTKLAYSQFKAAPLYLEWAPENVFLKSAPVSEQSQSNHESLKTANQVTNTDNRASGTHTKEEKVDNKESNDAENELDSEEPENDTTLFIKNVNFKTDENTLRAHFSSCGKIHNVTIAKKKDPKNPGQLLSMGYGFVQFYTKSDTNEALKTLQMSTLDGKTLELKRSERGNTSEEAEWFRACHNSYLCKSLGKATSRSILADIIKMEGINNVNASKKSSQETKQNGSKILVRNVPFQANRNELHEIFRAFGEIKTLRLPKKLTPGSEQHRGFAFVDFFSKTDAKNAFEALGNSTHLYGRRLVLEWAEQSEDDNVDALRKRVAETYNTKSAGGKKSKKSTVDVDTFVEGL